MRLIQYAIWLVYTAFQKIRAAAATGYQPGNHNQAPVSTSTEIAKKPLRRFLVAKTNHYIIMRTSSRATPFFAHDPEHWAQMSKNPFTKKIAWRRLIRTDYLPAITARTNLELFRLAIKQDDGVVVVGSYAEYKTLTPTQREDQDRYLMWALHIDNHYRAERRMPYNYAPIEPIGPVSEQRRPPTPPLALPRP